MRAGPGRKPRGPKRRERRRDRNRETERGDRQSMRKGEGERRGAVEPGDAVGGRGEGGEAEGKQDVEARRGGGDGP